MKKSSILLLILTIFFLSNVCSFAKDKAADTNKNLAQKTMDATKSAAKKTVEGVENITNKTIDGTKDLIDDISTGDVNIDKLEKKAAIKNLKNEKKALKDAYNSRIKDIKAKLKLTQETNLMSDVQKQNKIYTYEKQIQDLEQQRDSAIKKYDARINDLKNKK